MDTPTHYTTLGLAPSALDAVIRAAYKALALIHHPDKTVHLSPEERTRHASAFRAVQEAYDVLGGPSKRAYDTELARHGNRVDDERSTFHRATTPRKTTSVKSNGPPSIRLTTPEEKRAMKARMEEDLAHLREQRAKRDAEDADMDIAGLKVMHKIWTDLADEHRDDSSIQVHCAQQLEAYLTKIAQREREHADWIRSTSKAKTTPETPRSKTTFAHTPDAPRKATAPPFPTATPNTGSPHAPVPKTSASRSSATTPTSIPILRQRAKERKRAEAQRAEEARSRLQARVEELTRRDAAKQAHLDAKADAIRVQKDNLRQKAEERAQQEAELIAKARAKATPAAKGSKAAGKSTTNEEGNRVTKSAAKKLCAKCDAEHASFTDWRRCNLRESAQRCDASEDGEAFFFVV